MQEENVNAKTETTVGDVEEVVGEAEKNASADQQVMGEAIFCSYQSFLIFFYLKHFFTLPLHQVRLSSAGDTTNVVGEVVVEAKKYPAAEQQVQHLNHFLSIVVNFL
jgi:hypothetical protein